MFAGLICARMIKTVKPLNVSSSGFDDLVITDVERIV
jgi:hypothetical protein